MLYLTIAVLLLVVLNLLTLALVIGVVRRLREHESRIAGLSGAPGVEQLALPVGARPAGFRATSVDGAVIGEAELRGGVLLAVVSPSCDPCRRLTAELAGGRAGASGRRVIVLVAGTEPECAPAVARLRGATEVIVESEGGPVQQALRIRGYPVVLAFDDTAAVVWAGSDLDGVPAAAPA